MEKTNKQKGLIFNVQKFSIHDGHGIRTLVFLKGCPLRCVWCCNPESQSFSKELMLIKDRCIGCRRCVGYCPEKAIDMETLETDRRLCTVCGTCTRVCGADARKITGRWAQVDELIGEIEKDRIFYRNSQGGITVGGGEPTNQPDFTKALLRECKRLNLHTAIETCGFGEWEKIGTIFDYTDQIFFDLKHMDEEAHKKWTGVSNRIILENAGKAAALGKEITFRIPLVPGCNNSEKNIHETGRFISSLPGRRNHIKVEILPYHRLGSGKYAGLGKSYPAKGKKTPDTGEIDRCKHILRLRGCSLAE